MCFFQPLWTYWTKCPTKSSFSASRNCANLFVHHWKRFDTSCTCIVIFVSKKVTSHVFSGCNRTPCKRPVDGQIETEELGDLVESSCNCFQVWADRIESIALLIPGAVFRHLHADRFPRENNPVAVIINGVSIHDFFIQIFLDSSWHRNVCHSCGRFWLISRWSSLGTTI